MITIVSLSISPIPSQPKNKKTKQKPEVVSQNCKIPRSRTEILFLPKAQKKVELKAPRMIPS
jgi:hypothetical protein